MATTDSRLSAATGPLTPADSPAAWEVAMRQRSYWFLHSLYSAFRFMATALNETPTTLMISIACMLLRCSNVVVQPAHCKCASSPMRRYSRFQRSSRATIFQRADPRLSGSQLAREKVLDHTKTHEQPTQDHTKVSLQTLAADHRDIVSDVVGRIDNLNSDNDQSAMASNSVDDQLDLFASSVLHSESACEDLTDFDEEEMISYVLSEAPMVARTHRSCDPLWGQDDSGIQNEWCPLSDRRHLPQTQHVPKLQFRHDRAKHSISGFDACHGSYTPSHDRHFMQRSRGSIVSGYMKSWREQSTQETSTCSISDNDDRLVTSPKSSQSYWTDKSDISMDQFEILKTIGVGQFNHVALAKFTHNGTDQPVALKIFNKAYILKHGKLHHVTAELSVLRVVDHPFIVQFLGSIQNETYFWIILEYINRGDLFLVLRLNQKFTEPGGKFYASEVLLALQYLHDRHIIYRDLKPENLLVDSSGHIKVIDFGFATFTSSRTCTLCGTPDYVAPEIILSIPYNFTVDWWALGVLIYEMLYGFAPFRGNCPDEVYRSILKHDLEFDPSISPTAKDLITALLEFNPDKRLGRDGANSIKSHPWFEEIDWDLCFQKKLTPPWLPEEPESAYDTSQFEEYSNKDEFSNAISIMDQALFEQF